MNYIGSLTVHMSSGVRFEVEYEDTAKMDADLDKLKVIFGPQQTPMKIDLTNNTRSITMLSDAIVAYEELRL